RRTLTPFPYTTLFRSPWHGEPVAPRPSRAGGVPRHGAHPNGCPHFRGPGPRGVAGRPRRREATMLMFRGVKLEDPSVSAFRRERSEEHTSELQSPDQL